MHTYRLHLPGELVDDDRQKASYDVDSGEVYLRKLSTDKVHTCKVE